MYVLSIILSVLLLGALLTGVYFYSRHRSKYLEKEKLKQEHKDAYL